MSSSEVKLVFTTHFQVNGEGESAIENAIQKARAEYGFEVAEWGEFTITGTIKTAEDPVKELPVWTCPNCGATTTNPEDRLIEYAGLHLGCKGKKAANE